MTIADIIKATNGRLVQGDPNTILKGISIDSRSLKTGQLFIAIKGTRFDGHDFLTKAARSAGALLCQKSPKVKSRIPIIQVGDTTRALGQIARAHRQRFSIPVIAVTGSTGKTTTKEMIAAILKSQYKVLKNQGTENNHIGVPLTLLKLNSSHQVAVLELGSNQPGDIRWLTQIVHPTIVGITNIGESHLERLKTLDKVFKEKSAIIQYGPKQQTVILNADEAYFEKLKLCSRGKSVVTCSIKKKSSCQAQRIQLKKVNHLEFHISRGGLFTLKTSAVHNVYNALIAISCGRLLSISYNDIGRSLHKNFFPPGRQVQKRIGPWWVIDDTYNSNPVSLRSAVQTLSQLKGRGRKILVCADMLELGARSRRLHQELGVFIAQSHLDLLLTFGTQAEYLAEAVQKNHHPLEVHHCLSLNQIYQHLKHYCHSGDIILVKGSRAMRMERVVEFLQKEAGGV